MIPEKGDTVQLSLKFIEEASPMTKDKHGVWYEDVKNLPGQSLTVSGVEMITDIDDEKMFRIGLYNKQKRYRVCTLDPSGRLIGYGIKAKMFTLVTETVESIQNNIYCHCGGTTKVVTINHDTFKFCTSCRKEQL